MEGSTKSDRPMEENYTGGAETSSKAKQRRSSYTRTANWSQAAKLRLLELVGEKRRVIEGKRFDNKVSSQTRTEAWEHITAALNAAFPHSQRIPNQVEKKWYSLKSERKEEISAYNKVLKGTGGGDPPKPLSDVATLVQTILGPENVCISGIAELDAVSLQNGNTASAGSEHDLTANNKTVAEMAVIEIDQCDELEVQLYDDNAKLPNISVAGTAIKPPPPPSAHQCCSTCSCSTACEKAVLELELLRAQVAAAKAQAHAFDMWSEKIKSQMKK